MFGLYVTIITDHKLLLGILSEEKGIPQLAISRLETWEIILSGYNYTSKCKTRTSNSNVDCFSRFLKDCENVFGRSSRINRNFFRRQK